MRDDPDLRALVLSFLGLSVAALAVPGMGVRGAAAVTLLLAAVWGVRLGAWVHRDRDDGLLARAQVLEAGPGGTRARRVLSAFGGAAVAGSAIALPHALLAAAVLTPPGARVATLAVPLAVLAAWTGLGMGLALRPVLGDATTPVAGLAVVAASGGYWVLGDPPFLSVPPALLVFSVLPPPHASGAWAWGPGLPLASGVLPLAAGAVAGLAGADPLRGEPRWALLLVPALVVGPAAGAPAAGEAVDADHGPDREILILPPSEREPASAILRGDPGTLPPDRRDPAELPIRGERDVLVYAYASDGLHLPDVVRWTGGSVVLVEELGSWTLGPGGDDATGVGLWMGTAHLERSAAYLHDGYPPVETHAPSGFDVHHGARLPYHPLWAIAAGLPALLAAAPVSRWWRGPGA